MYKLEEYQEKAIEFLQKRNGNGAIAFPVGYGKTLTCLHYLDNFIDDHPILITVPAAILSQGTWQDEIEKFNINIPFSVLKGTPKKRLKILKETFKISEKRIFLLSHSNLKWLNGIFSPKNPKNKKRVSWFFETVVIDEMHKFKNSASINFRSMKAQRAKIKNLIGLTGTPKPNDITDLWAIAYLLDKGKTLGNKKKWFLDTFFDTISIPNQAWVKYRPKVGIYNGKVINAEDIINKRMRNLIISSNDLKHLLPPISYITKHVYLTEEEKEIYESLIKDRIVDINQDTQINIDSTMKMIMKLRQLASGFIYDDEENRSSYRFHNHKLEALEEILEQTDDNCIIATLFNADEKEISEKFNTPVFDGSPKMKEEWNAGKYKTMIINCASTKTMGGNLQMGGGTIIWYSPTWSYTDYTQLNGRVFRNGQKKNVNIYHIVTKGTIDEQMISNVNDKEKKAKELLALCKIK